jgi:hypothetical protein
MTFFTGMKLANAELEVLGRKLIRTKYEDALRDAEARGLVAQYNGWYKPKSVDSLPPDVAEALTYFQQSKK